MQRPETAWRLLADLGLGPDDVEIVRQLVYTFEARTAEQWRRGRTFLVGDAAHTMPPFMGQGMCSGMRDAKNLVWKLDLVLRGLASEALLDTFEEELRPYVTDWTVISLEAGRVPCITDPAAAAERDARFRAGFRPPLPDFPQLRHGVLADMPGAGELSLQGRVDGELFDRAYDAAGRWQVLSIAGDPRSALSASQVAFLESLGTVFAEVGGEYADHFASRGIEVSIARPDFYVFGTAASLGELGALVDDLAARLRVPVIA
jgi:hypothetical protein